MLKKEDHLAKKNKIKKNSVCQLAVTKNIQLHWNLIFTSFVMYEKYFWFSFFLTFIKYLK